LPLVGVSHYRPRVSFSHRRQHHHDTKERAMLQELNSREGDGITVTLYWDAEGGRTLIRLADDRTELDETFEIPGPVAADAFVHPFCYFTAPAPAEPLELLTV